MPRTTLNLDSSVLRELRVLQERDGRPLGDLVSGLLSRALRSEPPPAPPRLEWISKPMAARVDLDDRDAVRDAADEPG